MRYEKSLGAMIRAEQVTPGGAQTLSKQPARFPRGAYPFALAQGKQAVVLDVDGNSYIDWIAGLAAISLGYADDRIDQAVIRQIHKGVSFSLPTELETEVAEKLCAVIPCAEQVRFVKTGSEATEAAIRVARMATGRKTIMTVKGGYHGWHSWFTATRDDHPGVPDAYEEMVETFPYNDLLAVEKRLRTWEDVAAVIMEPCLYEKPSATFLQTIRDSCDRHGALLIFDEMVTGFRWRIAGGQEFFNVTPDLACFGKAMANGYPLACLCGPADLMKHATVVSGTFGGECVGLAACKATLEVYQQDSVIEHLWAVGSRIALLFNAFEDAETVGVKLDGYPVKPRLVFANDEGHFKLSFFLQDMAAQGHLIHPSGFNVMQAHTERQVDDLISCVAQTLRKMVLHEGDILRGECCQPNAFRPVPK